MLRLAPHLAPLRRASPFYGCSLQRRCFADFGFVTTPAVENEPFEHYRPGSPRRERLKSALSNVRADCPEIPCIVNGEEVFTRDMEAQVMPSDHQHTLCHFHKADVATIKRAQAAALQARHDWMMLPWHDRASVFLRAADIISSERREELMAAVMLGTGKNVWQAEVDAAVETIDFFRFNVHYVDQIYRQQPLKNAPKTWNTTEWRPLEGFVAAITPFNFLAIGANLPTTPALVGNTVLWKPSSSAVLGNYKLFKILQEAGLPNGVINFLPCEGSTFGSIFESPDLSGLHFTGSTRTFNHLQQEIARNLGNYRSYPRVVGETGGKDFHLMHASANVESFVNNTIRGAFEFNGQKCSACSRAYVPSSLWPRVRDALVEGIQRIKVGDPDDFSVFMTAVIDQAAFSRAKGYIDLARAAPDSEIIAGGGTDDSKGFFVEPTVIVSSNPASTSMTEEIFAPVLTVFVYEDDDWLETLRLVDSTSPYALTGSVFAEDRFAIAQAKDILREAAGNFYVNEKCTGAVVGQQPFGGARASGTNDKAGSILNLYRWLSPRTIKESFDRITEFEYPHMKED